MRYFTIPVMNLTWANIAHLGFLKPTIGSWQCKLLHRIHAVCVKKVSLWWNKASFWNYMKKCDIKSWEIVITVGAIFNVMLFFLTRAKYSLYRYSTSWYDVYQYSSWCDISMYRYTPNYVRVKSSSNYFINVLLHYIPILWTSEYFYQPEKIWNSV